MNDKDVIEYAEPVHDWFGLSYANYLTLPRSILQAMPLEWQLRFVQCLREMDSEFPTCWPQSGSYEVRVRDESGRYREDPLSNYRRPNQALIERLRKGEAD